MYAMESLQHEGGALGIGWSGEKSVDIHGFDVLLCQELWQEARCDLTPTSHGVVRILLLSTVLKTVKDNLSSAISVTKHIQACWHKSLYTAPSLRL